MIQAFKRYRGVTPGQYRRSLNHRGEADPCVELPEEGSGVFSALLCYAAAGAAELPGKRSPFLPIGKGS